MNFIKTLGGAICLLIIALAKAPIWLYAKAHGKRYEFWRGPQ